MNDAKSPACQIRRVRMDDYSAIVHLWREAGLPVEFDRRESEGAFRRQLSHFGPCYLLSEDNGEIIGVVLGTHDERKGWINRLAVHPKCRRRGVGKKLVAECEEAIRSCGIGIIAALVDPMNHGSCRLFDQMAYRTDVPVRYFRKQFPSRPHAGDGHE